jgi:hypothetical protein
MAQPAAPQGLLTVALLAFVAWRMYSRVRRNIGRQRFSPRRPWVTVVVFPLVLVLLMLSTRWHAPLALALAGGGVLGIALGFLGLRLTRFEVTPEGRFYTPSAHLGIALSALLVCRIAYRFIVHGLPGSQLGSSGPSPLTPLTLLLVGTLAGYYTTYAVGLLRWSRRTPQVPAPVPAPAPADPAQRS